MNQINTLAVFALAAALMGCSNSTSSKPTVTMNPDRDATLYESESGSESNGLGQHILVGNSGQGRSRRGLIHFDVETALQESGEVQNSRVNKATLTLSMSRTSSDASQHISMHRVTTDWSEGPSDPTGNEGVGDSTITSGDATWLHADRHERMDHRRR